MREIQAAGADGEAQNTESPQQELADAIEGIRNLRKRNGTVAFEELRTAREEGHKY